MKDELIGKVFGYWTVIEKDKPRNEKDKHKMYICKCICGEKRSIRKSVLINNRSKSCGCNGKIKYKGKRFGRLTCISDLLYTIDKNGQKRKAVKVKCDCGTEKIAYTYPLEKGITLSCGCYNKEVLSTHCKERHPNYNPELTDEEREANNSRMSNKGYQTFRRHVLQKYNYTCQCCGLYRKNNMRVHHIYSWNIDKDKRLDENNAIVLCPNCHDIQYSGSFHNIYGNGNNTKEQLDEYIKMRQEAVS